MGDNDIPRVARLTAILTQLQTRRLTTAKQLSEQFGVSIRTVYRDIRSLEAAGVPVLTEEGKGYTLMEGYKVPPVMFTEGEANALITASGLLAHHADTSLKAQLDAAVAKVKAVLPYPAKEKADLLSGRIALSPALAAPASTSSLVAIQEALTSFRVLEITYTAGEGNEQTARAIEPFAFYFSLQESWLLIAWCRLRRDFRMFRLDRIGSLKMGDERFEPHKLTLAEYLADKQNNFRHP
ncbi:MAG: YafY family transcriptional regulator [Chitinophagaceae bacterium]|nr:MAG: YafY family transcriptional regulator [Chitinophagaceae bacterium]